MGETRVDLIHLLEDLRDAYPGALEETILTEIIANSLDSRATCIRIVTDAPHAALTVIDDGGGMQRRALACFHDVAASTKARGEGIGFAGVGIKLGLLVSAEVFTETRRGKTHVATRWHLASRHRAPWKWVPPSGLVTERGTAVRLSLRNALSPLLDAGFVEATVRRHYQPLLDAVFATILAPYYPCGVSFEVNGRQLAPEGAREDDVASLEVRLLRKRKPAALGYLVRGRVPLADDQRGIAISTLGKIIKRGWDWLGVAPAARDMISGLIEVPALAGSLTLNKADFIRAGARGAAYLSYRKAIQEAVSRQLALWGDTRDSTEEARRRVARPLERDLERVLADLVTDFPLVATLIDRLPGGQRRLPMGRAASTADGRSLIAASIANAAEVRDDAGTHERDESVAEPHVPSEGTPATAFAAETSGVEPTVPANGPLTPGDRVAPRPARLGLNVQFEDRSGDDELAHLVQSTVWVNTAHPAYRRAAASRSEGYHIALAAALALAPLAVEPAHEHAFVTAFLTCWGTEAGRENRRARRLG